MLNIARRSGQRPAIVELPIQIYIASSAGRSTGETLFRVALTLELAMQLTLKRAESQRDITVNRIVK